jgi:hypothetical protein
MKVATELERLQAATHRGMAHWAGTGPTGTICGGCEFFKFTRGSLVDGRCHKILRGAKKSRSDADVYPASTASCRHFEERA